MIKLPRRQKIAAIAFISAAAIPVWWAIRPNPTISQTPPGAALQALASPPNPDADWLVNPAWLLTKFCIDSNGNTIATDNPGNCAGQPFGRSTDDSLQQLLMWSERYRQNAINIEAQRLISRAIEFTNQPGHPCHHQSLDACYQSFEANLKQAIAATSDPTELARLTAKMQALAIARSGQSPRVEQISKTQIQQALERYSQDLQLAKSAGLDGLIELSNDIQQEVNQ